MQVGTRAITVRLAGWAAEALFARCAWPTDVAAGTAVIVVGIRIDAGAVAINVARGAATNALLAALSIVAGMTTRTAVVSIGVEVDAGAITQGLTAWAAGADATGAGLAWLAGMSTGTAIVGIGVEIDAGVTALSQPARTDADAVAAHRSVAAMRFGGGAGLARQATGTGRGK